MKKTILIFYAVMLVSSLARTSSWMSTGDSLRLYSYDAELSDYNKLVPNIMNELMSGPLSGRSITLLLDEDTPLNSFQTDDLLEATEHPVLLLRLPTTRPKTTMMNHTYVADLTFDDYIEYFPLTHSILIIFMGINNPSWWPLMFPPDHWHMKEIVLIVSSHMCAPEDYLQTPLLERPSSVAVLCPYQAQRAPAVLPFVVWTLKPYVMEGQLVNLGMWSRESFKTWHDFFIDRFHDMTLYNMSILAQTEDRPLVYRLYGGTGTLKGLNVIIMQALQYWLKFDLKFKTKRLLRFTENFETMMRGENDVFINYGTITPIRSEMFEITVPYFREGFGIMLEIPPPLPTWQNILYPFNWWVWGAIIVAMLSVTVTYHMLNYKYEPSFTTNGIITMQSLLSNPMANVPEIWRLRNFLLVWWLVSWCLNLSYTCNLIAVLTVPVMPKKLHTSEELIASDYSLCMVDYGEFLDEALAESTNPIFEALYKMLEMVPASDVMEHIGEEQCIERVIAGTHAHTETFSYVVILYNMLGHGTQVYSFEEQLYPGYLAFFVRKHVPWKYKFDEGMEQMLEAGLVDKWYWDAMADFEGYVDKTKRETLVPLSLGHLSGPFLFYGLGILLSCIVMLSEVLFPHNLYK